MKRSWPFCAETSEAARVARSTRLILSTTTFVLFFCPHSLVKLPLNHVSKAGTKWLHCRIFSVFCCAKARSGNKKEGPTLAANAPAPANLTNSRREIRLPRFLDIEPFLLKSEPSYTPDALHSVARNVRNRSTLYRDFSQLASAPAVTRPHPKSLRRASRAATSCP